MRALWMHLRAGKFRGQGRELRLQGRVSERGLVGHQLSGLDLDGGIGETRASSCSCRYSVGTLYGFDGFVIVWILTLYQLY